MAPKLQHPANQFPQRGQSSAFVNCNPGVGTGQSYSHSQSQPPQMFQPAFMQRAETGRVGQFVPQQPPLRPPGMQPPRQQQPGAGAEFRAFFQDLQVSFCIYINAVKIRNFRAGVLTEVMPTSHAR